MKSIIFKLIGVADAAEAVCKELRNYAALVDADNLDAWAKRRMTAICLTEATSILISDIFIAMAEMEDEREQKRRLTELASEAMVRAKNARNVRLEGTKLIHEMMSGSNGDLKNEN